MSQSSNNRRNIIDQYYAAMDSPMAQPRNHSRFSKLAFNRTKTNNSFNLANDSASSVSMNQSNLSTNIDSTMTDNLINSQLSMIKQQQSPLLIHNSMNLGNVSPSPSSAVLTTAATPKINFDDDQITEDEMARLSIFQEFFELNQKFLQPFNLLSTSTYATVDGTIASTLSSQHQQQQNILNVFSMIESFHNTCDDNLIVTKRLLENNHSTLNPLQTTEHHLNYLNKFYQLIRLERNIWCLFKVLFVDRFQSTIGGDNNNQQQLNIYQNINNDNNRMDIEIEEDMRLRLNDSELVERVMEKNSMLREMQIVIDWLESMYEDEDEKFSVEKMNYYSNGPCYWENTLHQLKINKNKQKQSSLFTTNQRVLCQEMDPDASIRNGQPLHDLDKEDENRLFHHLFKLIRAGKLQEGKEIAERFGYFWLSAALDGWIFFNDPNYNDELNNTRNDREQQQSVTSSPNSNKSSSMYSSAVKQLIPIYGNPYRDLWKYTSWKCSKMDGTNLYERAIFAIFSGNRSILMPLCNKWMDKLWAYFKCSLDVHLENSLIDTNISKPDMQPRVNVELPDSYWDNRLTPKEIFHELEIQFSLQTSTFITHLEEECYRLIVKHLILSNVDQLIENLYEWSKSIQTNRQTRMMKKSILKTSATSASNDQLSLSTSSWLNTSINLSGTDGNLKTTATNKLRDMEDELMIKVIEPNLLRLFAHIVICLKNLNQINDSNDNNDYDNQKHKLCIEIIEIYIGFLIEFKLIELIAYYIKFLPEIKQIQTFSTLLETIDDDSDRRLCLIIAKNAKLNINAILTLTLDNIRLNKTGYQLLSSKSIPHANFGQLNFDNNNNNQQQQQQSDNESKATLSLLTANLLSNQITEQDYRKINSLNWLLLDGDNPEYLELLWQSNALIRMFLLEQKIDLAYSVYDRLPKNIINKSYNEWKLSKNFDSGFDIENVIREYLCHQTYFDANESFKKWHHFLYSTKPREPNKPKHPINRISDRVLYEQRLKSYENDLEVWTNQLHHQAKNTSKKILDFLCFPNGIWKDVIDSNLIQEIDQNFDYQNNDRQSVNRQLSIAAATAGEEAPSIFSTEITSDYDYENNRRQNMESMMDDDQQSNDNFTINDYIINNDIEQNLILKQQLERKQNEWQNYRPKQLNGIRKIYVPQFCFLLHSIYRDSNDYSECLRIADLIADEQHQLYSTFTKEQLIDFLALIRESAIKILDKKSDPFGCNHSDHNHQQSYHQLSSSK